MEGGQKKRPDAGNMPGLSLSQGMTQETVEQGQQQEDEDISFIYRKVKEH
jgi:hypothetical protein